MTAGPRPRRRVAPMLALLVVAALGVALAVGLGRSGTPGAGASTPAALPAAPALAGRTLDGERFDLARLRGQVVLVNVFASWCGPCRTELPLLSQAQRRWSEQGLRLVGLDVRDGVEPVRELLRETGAELPVLPDPSGSIAVDWGVRGVPETFVVDRDGRIAHQMRGVVTLRWLEQRIPPLLAP